MSFDDAPFALALFECDAAPFVADPFAAVPFEDPEYELAGDPFEAPAESFTSNFFFAGAPTGCDCAIGEIGPPVCSCEISSGSESKSSRQQSRTIASSETMRG